jgi:hypothetical protein
MRFAAPAIALFAAFALVAADDSWAGGRGRGGGGHRGSAHHSGARPGVVHHHHHPHFVGRSVFVGVPFYYPGPYYYYPPPPNYYAPPVYIEQYPGTPAPQSQDWFFCPSAGAYYPYVNDCPGGWQRVVPSQPAQSSPVG